MNTQQIFDKVATHLLTQNRQAMTLGGCMYRAEDGAMCAVGCLINDNEYTEELEGRSLWDEITYEDGYSTTVREAVERSIGRPITMKEYEMLRDLQQVHDGAGTDIIGMSTVELWPDALRRVAKQYRLSDKVVDNA